MQKQPYYVCSKLIHVLVTCTLAHMKAMDALIKNTKGNRAVI